MKMNENVKDLFGMLKCMLAAGLVVIANLISIPAKIAEILADVMMWAAEKLVEDDGIIEGKFVIEEEDLTDVTTK